MSLVNVTQFSPQQLADDKLIKRQEEYDQMVNTLSFLKPDLTKETHRKAKVIIDLVKESEYFILDPYELGSTFGLLSSVCSEKPISQDQITELNYIYQKLKNAKK